MSLIFVDWKSPPQEEDNESVADTNTDDEICAIEEDIRKLCKERIMSCLIPLMNLFLMAFVWTVSLKYGSVLMPSVLTLIIIVLYVFNYMQEHAIRYAIADIMHLRHDTPNRSQSPSKDRESALERCDSSQSKINYFNHSKSYCIETIDENCEELEESPSPSGSSVQ